MRATYCRINSSMFVASHLYGCTFNQCLALSMRFDGSTIDSTTFDFSRIDNCFFYGSFIRGHLGLALDEALILSLQSAKFANANVFADNKSAVFIQSKFYPHGSVAKILLKAEERDREPRKE